MTRTRQDISSAKRRIAAAALVCLLATGSATVWADIIHLKDGAVLRGEIVKEDGKTITLRLPYGTMVIERDHVKAVEKEDALKVLVGEADALLKSGKTDQAVEKLEDTLRRYPASASVIDRLVPAYRRQSDVLRTQGKLMEVDRIQRRILELAPGDNEAAEQVRKVDEIRNNAAATEKEATLLVSLGRERESLDLFAGLATFVPGSADTDRKCIARAHADYGRRLLELKRLDEARRHYDVAVKLDPALLPELKHEVFVSRFSPIVTEMNEKGRTLSQDRWETILAELKALQSLEDSNVHLHFAMGLCEQELKHYVEAAREYARVTGDKVDPERAADQLPALMMLAQKKTHEAPIVLSFPQSRFTAVRPGPAQLLETTHFIIHHYNDELALLVARGAEYYLERNYRVFLEATPEKPWPKKCDIFIYRSKEEYLEHSHQAEWSPAMASTSAVGGMLDKHQILTYQGVEDLLSSHLSHEITHIIQSAVLNYSGGIPTWLREGTAVRQEPWFKRIRMAKVIREAKEKGRLMTLDQLLQQKGYPNADGVNLFYSQSYALVEAIQQAGNREQFTQFCREAVERPPLEAAERVYGLNREELTKSWERHQDDLMSLLDKP